MAKKGLDHDKLSNLFSQGLEEARGGKSQAEDKKVETTTSPKPKLSKKTEPTTTKAKPQIQGMYLSFSKELANALYRFQIDFREQHPDLNGNQTRISAAVEHLLRKSLSMKPLV